MEIKIFTNSKYAINSINMDKFNFNSNKYKDKSSFFIYKNVVMLN